MYIVAGVETIHIEVLSKSHSNALAFVMRRLIGYRQQFATVYLRYTV